MVKNIEWLKGYFLYLVVILWFSPIPTTNAQMTNWLGGPLTIEPELIKMPELEGMVFIKGGCFDMGDTFGDGEEDEKPVHNVCVDDFYMGKYEVTQQDWIDVMSSNPSYFQRRCNKCPVENISWDDTQEYIWLLSDKAGKIYRLPTDAEWEYAARSGGKREKFAGFSNEDQLYLYANFCSHCDEHWWQKGSQNDRYEYTSPVGSYRPNGLGLYDMTGNVWEWVADWYDGSYYKVSPQDNPNGPMSGKDRVRRGGSWRENVPKNLRASARYRTSASTRGYYLGFRIVVSAQSFGDTAKYNKQCESEVINIEEGNKFVENAPEKAEIIYRDVVKKCPDSKNATYNLAMSLYNQRRNSQAIKILKGLINASPDHIDSMRLLAYILVIEGIDPSNGKMLAETILESNPKDEGAKKILMLVITKDIKEE